jgi:hypothetical protein
MTTKRVQISRPSRWRISPFAVKLWAQMLELEQGQRNRHGELVSEADRDALRDTWIALAAEIGASKFYHEPHRILDDRQPWPWVHDAGQLQNWEESRQIRDLLNAALLETARATAAQRRAKRAQAEPQSEPKAL